ncbi:MAG: hypothetical protein AAFN40_03335 [Cyanobacteria bacterium J06560_6]
MSNLSYAPFEIATTALGKNDTIEPGKAFTLGVTITNTDNHQALDVEVSIDHLPEDLIWTDQPTRLALFPQQSEEVIFQIRAPEVALPRLVTYTLRVTDPNATPDSPQRILDTQQLTLRILPLDRTESSTEDPSFYIEPATSSDSPQKIQPLAGIPMQVWVNNRSDLVDRFRLQCEGLPKGWEVSITYPQDGLGLGLMAAATELSLNPGDRGQISLMIKPPADALAGVYSPTLQLISENKPALKLLHLTYLEVPSTYLLQPSLHSLRGQFRQGSALFELQLLNSGNSPREIDIAVEALEESERYDYVLEKTTVRVLPQSTQRVGLEILPRQQRQRPWYGGGHFSNVRFKLKDRDNHPLSVETLQGNFTWLARPWWQLLLCVLLVLGLVGGTAGLVWWFLLRSPTISTDLILEPSSNRYSAIDDDAAKVDITVPSPELIKTMRLTGFSAEGEMLTEPIEYDFEAVANRSARSALSNETLPHGLKNLCSIQPRKDVLDCAQVHTGATKPGTYTFNLEVVYKHRGKFSMLSESSSNVVIESIPLPVVKANQTSFTEAVAENSEASAVSGIPLSIDLWNPQEFKSISLVGKSNAGDIFTEVPYDIWDPNNGNVLSEELQEKGCGLSADSKQLTCPAFIMPVQQIGTFHIEAMFTPKVVAAVEDLVRVATESITIQPAPMTVARFMVNGQNALTESVIRLPLKDPEETPVKVIWAMAGGATMEVTLLTPAEAKVERSGEREFVMKPGDRRTITIRGTDGAGRQEMRAVEVEAVGPPPVSPEEAAAAMGAAIAAEINNANQSGTAEQQSEGTSTLEVPSSVNPEQASPIELPPVFN